MASSPAAALAHAIASTGAQYAFGVPGGGPNLDVVGALDDRNIAFILGHHETATAIMATTYGALTNSVTAVVVTRGPGAAAVVNGAAQATLDRQPLLVVTDTVPSAGRDRVAHQRIDQRAMFAPVTKAGGTIGSATTVDDLVHATELAAAAPAGAVHLDYDATTQGSVVEQPTPAAAIAPADRDRCAQLLLEATRPVVIIGDGASAGGDGLRQTLTEFGAPVLATYQAIGLVPTETELAAGLFTNGETERPLLEQCDLVIAIGLDMVEPIPKAWTYAAPVISFAPAATVDPYLPIEAELIGSIDDIARSLLDGASHDWPPTAAEHHRTNVRRQLSQHGHTGFGPIELVTTAAAHCPPTATVTVDAGAHFLAIMPFWPAAKPNQLLISNGLATMGYAIPAAIGAALARPDEPVIAFVGDGGLGMTLAELETIARLALPITVIVFNDSALSLIEIKQQPHHGGSAAVKYLPTDFAATAIAHGMTATAVASQTELATALGACDFASPHLIDARIDPGAYPHLITTTRG